MHNVSFCVSSLSSPDPAPSLEVMLDRTSYLSKPPRGHPAWIRINEACARNRESISIPELARLLQSGCSFTPGVFRDERRANATWVQQQVFALDCENGYTPDEFLELSRQWDVWPAFMYPSFNHTEDKPRFRAVFVCDHVICDKRLRALVQGQLMELFDGRHIGKPQTIDQQCRDCARFFLGTNTRLIHESFESLINPIQLLDTFLKHKKQTDAAHYADWVKKLAVDHQIALRGNRELGVVAVEYVSHRVQQPGETDVGVYSVYTPTVNSPGDSRCSTVSWNGVLYEVQWNINNHQSNNPNIRRAKADDSSLAFKPTGRLTASDKTALLNRCRLLREFMSGERHLHHHERRLLITNLQWREGGVKWFREGLNQRDDYRADSLVEDAKRYAMRPEGCRNCPYCDDCDHKTNLLQQLAPKRRECRQIRPSPPRMTLEETRRKLREALSECMASSENKVFVIKCDAGVGKTEELFRQNLEGVCVAFDTHRLKNEAYQRLRQQGRDTYLWPEPPALPAELNDKLQRCYAIGAGGTAEVFRQALEHPTVSLDTRWAASIQRYLQALHDIHLQSSVFTTHDKAYQLQRNPQIHTIVFDEDFTKTLIRIDEIRLRDIEVIRKIIRESNDERYAEIDEHLKSVLHAPSRITHPQSIQGYQTGHIHSLLLRTPKSFESPLEALFYCDAYRKDSSDPNSAESVFCITRQKLREDRKFIVLSATADETVCRMLFGDRLRFIDLSGTEIQGKLYCHTKRSYSKQSIYRDSDGFVEQVKKDMADYGFEGIITHKFCVEGSNESMRLQGTDDTLPVFGTFGGLQGLDSYGGKDMAVYGTPYPPEYVVKLWAYILGLDVDEDTFDFDERLVEWGEYEGELPSVSANPDLQRLYLWLAHSEIIQAVGRARLVNHDCKVHVFAKLPVSGCVLVA